MIVSKIVLVLSSFITCNFCESYSLNGGSDIVAYSNYVYAIAFPFSIDGRQFFYQNDLVSNDLERRKWVIKELLPDGKLGEQTSNGSWTDAYDVTFPFSIEDKHFIYAQNLNDKSWFLRELLSGGKMGDETAKGSWQIVYESVFPYSINGRHFFYGKSVHGGHWFLQELLPGGKMGTETANGDTSVHEGTYEATFPFSIGGKQFYYRQNLKNNHEWFIQELLPDGKMGKQTANGQWKKSYSVVFPFSIDEKQYFYGQSLYDRNWFIQELLPGGKMGKETAKGDYEITYEYAFPFSFNDTQFFYGQNINSRNWFIQKLLPGGGIGEKTDVSL